MRNEPIAYYYYYTIITHLDNVCFLYGHSNKLIMFSGEYFDYGLLQSRKSSNIQNTSI